MKKLTRDEMRNINGGLRAPEFGCGTGISCSGKQGGDACGTKSCACQTNSSTDTTLYCQTQDPGTIDSL